MNFYRYYIIKSTQNWNRKIIVAEQNHANITISPTGILNWSNFGYIQENLKSFTSAIMVMIGKGDVLKLSLSVGEMSMTGSYRGQRDGIMPVYGITYGS